MVEMVLILFALTKMAMSKNRAKMERTSGSQNHKWARKEKQELFVVGCGQVIPGTKGKANEEVVGEEDEGETMTLVSVQSEKQKW
jgi:hypothetical protein